MPIVGNGKNTHIEYQIPEKIKNKIPQHFYIAFAGELCSVFGHMIFQKDESDVYSLFYVSSTAGWNEALKMTCQKLNMCWLLDYYNSLEWYESDLFDGEMEDKIVSEFIEADQAQANANAYYKFLFQRKDEN